MIITGKNLMIRYVNPINGQEWGHPLLREGRLVYDLQPGQVMRRITYDREGENMKPYYTHCAVLVIDKNGITIDVAFSTPKFLPWVKEMDIWRTESGRYGPRHYKERKTFNLLLQPCGVLRELVTPKEMKYKRGIFREPDETAHAENLAHFAEKPEQELQRANVRMSESNQFQQARLF